MNYFSIQIFINLQKIFYFMCQHDSMSRADADRRSEDGVIIYKMIRQLRRLLTMSPPSYTSQRMSTDNEVKNGEAQLAFKKQGSS